MSKRFKLKFLNINIPSFQLCRPKSSSSLPKIPKPAKYRRSPVNPKSFDVTFPSSSPAPPPSTPEFSFFSSSTSWKKTRSSNGCGSSSDQSRQIRTVKTTPSSKKKMNQSRKPSHVFTLISSDEEEEEENDNEDDSLVLLDSSRSFSSEQYRPSGTGQYCYRDRASVPIKTTAEKRKARESVAVVKRSENPYEDFKRSMLEMIVEKQMFGVGDLEELLQSFLTLNSKQYHGIIVEAFSEIWEILFCDNSPRLKHRLSI